MSGPKKSTRPRSRSDSKGMSPKVLEGSTRSIDGLNMAERAARDKKPTEALTAKETRLDRNKDGIISGPDFKKDPKKMKGGGRAKAKGYAMGGKVKAKGMAMGGKIKSKGMAMGGKVKAKGMAMGGKIKSKGMAMGGKIKSKGMAMGGKIKSKGMAMGGKVKAKGMAMGGVATSKGMAMGGRGFGAARSSGIGTRIF